MAAAATTAAAIIAIPTAIIPQAVVAEAPPQRPLIVPAQRTLRPRPQPHPRHHHPPLPPRRVKLR